ncbi:MAG: hypothetical protein AAB597_02710 [Patescibacteria group bacterium]
MKIHAEDPRVGSVTWEIPASLAEYLKQFPKETQSFIQEQIRGQLVLAVCSIGAPLCDLRDMGKTQAYMTHLQKTLGGFLKMVDAPDTESQTPRLT